MIIRLNGEAVEQLNMIMIATGFKNPTHCVQVMLSQVNKKILIAKTKVRNT